MRVISRLFAFCVVCFICSCRKSSTVDEEEAADHSNEAHSNLLDISQSTNRSRITKTISPSTPSQTVATLCTRLVHRPSADLLLSLRPEDKGVLTAYYKAHTDPLDRYGVTWALGLVGDEQTVDLFARALTNDFQGKTLTGRRSNVLQTEENALEGTIYALGLLGSQYDSAFDFLVGATEPSFWAQHKNW